MKMNFIILKVKGTYIVVSRLYDSNLEWLYINYQLDALIIIYS